MNPVLAFVYVAISMDLYAIYQLPFSVVLFVARHEVLLTVLNGV